MRDRIRRGMFVALRGIGVLRLWRFHRRYDVNILMVHGTMEATPERPGGRNWVPLRPQLAPSRLEATIRFLARHFRFVSLEEAEEMLAGRMPIRPYCLVLTFDDGYRNNFTHALPILRKHGVPATFFLTTGPIERREPFWFDRLDYTLQHAGVHGRTFRAGGETIVFDASDRESLRRSYRRLRDAAKAVRRDDFEMLREIEAMTETLEKESGRRLADVFEEDDWSCVMTWTDIQREKGTDISFGSHTVDHVRLDLAGRQAIRDQLRRSKESIEKRTGIPCRHLCYPNGSYGPAVRDIAISCGYTCGVLAEPGRNRVGDDLMALHRIHFPETACRSEILATASGFRHAVSGGSRRSRSSVFRRS